MFILLFLGNLIRFLADLIPFLFIFITFVIFLLKKPHFLLKIPFVIRPLNHINLTTFPITHSLAAFLLTSRTTLQLLILLLHPHLKQARRPRRHPQGLEFLPVTLPVSESGCVRDRRHWFEGFKLGGVGRRNGVRGCRVLITVDGAGCGRWLFCW